MQGTAERKARQERSDDADHGEALMRVRDKLAFQERAAAHTGARARYGRRAPKLQTIGKLRWVIIVLIILFFE